MKLTALERFFYWGMEFIIAVIFIIFGPYSLLIAHKCGFNPYD